MIDLDDELAEEYLTGCVGHLAAIETDLLAIEKGGATVDEQQLLNRISQAVHAVGGAGVFGLVAIRDLAHRMEAALAAIRSGKLAVTPDRIGVLLRAADGLRDLIQDPGSSNQAGSVDLMAALAGMSGDPAPAAPRPKASTLTEAQPGDRRLRVLLVEDDFASRLMLQAFLSRYGECHIAVNGREAVEAFRSALDGGQNYDLVCMDIMMPEMDGREAARQVRALEEGHGILSANGAKIVMTTAVHDFKEVIQCFQGLCDAYLLKPINLSKLLRQMRSWELIR